MSNATTAMAENQEWQDRRAQELEGLGRAATPS